MPAKDESDSPVKGFDLVMHEGDGLYLHCRGRECHWRRRVPRVSHLDKLLWVAAAHRRECDRMIQQTTSGPHFPIPPLEQR